jgi:hypothetical protein
MNDDAIDALEAEDELEELSPEEIQYREQREAMIEAERDSYYGDLGIRS